MTYQPAHNQNVIQRSHVTWPKQNLVVSKSYSQFVIK